MARTAAADSSAITDSLIVRALLGALGAGLVAAFARRAGMLTHGGRWAAFITGAVATAAGWGWAVLLVAYFFVSAALTRLGWEAKRVAVREVLPMQGERNATQVAANGGLFALLVFLGDLLGAPLLLAAGLGALAAAAADTWATEVGLLLGGEPRSILTARRVPRGESGGVTFAGLGASAVAAVAFAAASLALIPTGAGAAGVAMVAVALGAMGGSVADSLLGATLQSKRWCDNCRTWTERRVHTCRYRTQHARGVRWMTNDTVNFLATCVGALVSLIAFGWLT
jgi:uncharacterized protein (TIGR00297 family)